MADGQVDVRIGSTPHGAGLISGAQRSLAAGPWQWMWLAAVVGAAILADQFTKYEVLHRLGPDDSAETFGPLSIHRIENPGIAFGLFSSATSIVIVLTVAAVGWMLAYFARSGARHPIIPAGLGLLVGGSLANLIDRVRLGHVTDFIDVGLGSAFNLADSFIVCGVIALLGALLAVDRRPSGSRRHRVV